MNVGFFNRELNESDRNLYTRVTTDLKKYVVKSHLSPGQRNDPFRFLMEDVDESSSENNTVVSGIVD